MQVSAYRHFESKKSISDNTKWIHVAPDDILRSYEANQSVCARNWTLFTTLLPVLQSLRQTEVFGSQTNYSFQLVLFSELVELVYQIRLNRVKQVVAWAAKISF